MAHIRHITSNHHEKEITVAQAAEMVRVCDTSGDIRLWSDMLGGKILQFATIRLGHNCGKIEVAYASKS